MIKMEYRRTDKKTIYAQAEISGKLNDIVDELAAFLEDLHESDPRICVLAIDRFIGVELERERR